LVIKIKSILTFFIKLFDKIIFLKGFNEKDSIIIIGSPRTGTTWIMEILNNLPQYTTIFEPLHPIWFPRVKELKLSMRHYETADSDNGLLYDYLHKVFNGEVTSQRPRYRLTFANILKRVTAKKLIVKFVRANRLVPWIVNNYNLRAVIFITRHPCATISSQFRTGYTGYDTERFIPSVVQVVEDAFKLGFESNILKKLEGLKTEAEILAAIWAMDQIIPLREKNEKIFIISYEDLLFYPEQTITHLLRFLNEMNHYENIIKKVETPSMTSRKKSSKEVKEVTWKDQITAVQIEEIRGVLEWFGISFDDRGYTVLNNNLPLYHENISH